MRPDDPRHGTQAGRSQHYRDGENACDACLHGDALAGRRRRKRTSMGYAAAHTIDDRILAKLNDLRERGATYQQIADWAGVEFHTVYEIINGASKRVHTKTYQRLIAFKAPAFVTAVGMTRRIQALHALGYSLPKISAAMGGLCRPRLVAIREGQIVTANAVTKDRLAAAYDQLSMTPAPTETVGERKSATRARNMATNRGWPPPLCWDDIDDPNERPASRRGRISYSPEELAAEWDHLRRAGESIEQAAKALGVTVDAIEKAIERARKAAA